MVNLDRALSRRLSAGNRIQVVGGLVMLMLMQAGCASERPTAEHVYAQRCAGCHGVTGAGDGPVARTLPDQPASFASSRWRATVSKEYVRQVIVRGGTQTGISPLMPSNEDLNKQPVVLNSLVDLVLGLSE